MNEDIEQKVLKDLERIYKTTTPERLIYCAKQPLTEDKLDKIVAQLHRELPSIKSVSAFGSIQLAKLSDNHQGVFDHFYELEKRNIENRLNVLVRSQESAETKGLRLALIAFGSEDAVVLRCELLKRVILESLFELGPTSVADLSRAISDGLKLQFQLNKEYIERGLAEAERDEFVQNVGSLWELTEKGKVTAKVVPTNAVKDLLAGRSIIKETLETLIGQTIDLASFESCWNVLLDFLSELFYSKRVWHHFGD